MSQPQPQPQPQLPCLSRIVEGVEFKVTDAGRSIRVVATRELLENVFGAAPSPDGWLDAYMRHRAYIHSAVDLLYRNHLPGNWREALVLSERLWSELPYRACMPDL